MQVSKRTGFDAPIISVIDENLAAPLEVPIFDVWLRPYRYRKDCDLINRGVGADTQSPATNEEQSLNAYYDDVSADRWLYAEIIECSPPAAKILC